MVYIPNSYYILNKTSSGGDQDNHRAFVGGLWEEVGQLQFDFLISQGLKPDHCFLDVGCGCLRAGVKIVEYLEAGRYYGVDISTELIEAGYNKELDSHLKSKLPRENLIVSGNFNFNIGDVKIDFAIAQSVFTHLPLNHLKLCLSKIHRLLNENASFYISFFRAESMDVWQGPIVHKPGEIKTYPESDPFHYLVSQLEECCTTLPFEFEYIGNWNHPRGQELVRFIKQEEPKLVASKTREIDREQALELPAGADNYRAFVGPPNRYDFMSSTQFALLFALGVRETSHVLDVGCGSLRLGRLLIPYLLPGRYAGVDPNGWLIEDGIRYELGRDAISLKKPVFSGRSDYRFSAFDRKFDFVVAQSVATHTGPDQLNALFEGAAASLSENGIFVFSFIEAANHAIPPNGWHYPECVGYQFEYLKSILGSKGLFAERIPWFHPGAHWVVSALNPSVLPSEDEKEYLLGLTLGDKP